MGYRAPPWRHPEDGMLRAFIRSLVSDNPLRRPQLPSKSPSQTDGVERKRSFDGDWDYLDAGLHALHRPHSSTGHFEARSEPGRKAPRRRHIADGGKDNTWAGVIENGVPTETIVEIPVDHSSPADPAVSKSPWHHPSGSAAGDQPAMTSASMV